MLFFYSEDFNTPFKDKKFRDGIKAVFISKHLCQNWSCVLPPRVICQAVLSLLREQAVCHIHCFCNGRHPLPVPKILWSHKDGRDQWMGKGYRKPQAVIKSNVPAAGSFTHPAACSSCRFWEAPTSRSRLPRDPHKGQAWGCQDPGHTMNILCLQGIWQQLTYRASGLYLTCTGELWHSRSAGADSWEGWWHHLACYRRQLSSLKCWAHS